MKPQSTAHMEVRIRRATASEQAALVELQRRAALANPGDRAAMLAHPDAIELPMAQVDAGQVVVAERGAEVLGFAVTLPREDGNAELDGLFVEPPLWGQGIGRALVQHCAAHARVQGSQALHVVGNPHAEGFYLACGFELLGTQSTQFGLGLLMRLPLPAER